MNFDRLKKSAGQRVHLCPQAIVLDKLGRDVTAQDFAWLIESVSDELVRISNQVTNHFTDLGKDHIHHYTSNPDETRRTGIAHGFFTLTVQLYIQGLSVRLTPCARPGKPVAPRLVPPIERSASVPSALTIDVLPTSTAQGQQPKVLVHITDPNGDYRTRWSVKLSCPSGATLTSIATWPGSGKIFRARFPAFEPRTGRWTGIATRNGTEHHPFAVDLPYPDAA